MGERLRPKIHHAPVSEARPDSFGSKTNGEFFLANADVHEHQHVVVANLKNGNRVETYITRRTRRSDQI
jgi:aspartate 1-decarboxylase